MATPIRIKVGCSLSSDWDKPFASIERRAKQAGASVRQNMRAGGGAGAGTGADQHAAAEKRKTRVTQTEAQKRLAAIRKEAKQREREHAQLLREVERDERRQTQAAAREAQKRARLAAQETRAAKTEARKRERIAAQEAMKRTAEMERFARRTSHRATRFLMPNAPLASMARRGALDLARGAGVETNLGSLVSRVLEADKAARELSVKGYVSGAAGAPGQRVDPDVLREEARALGEEMGMTTEEILRGQSAFVDLRGNLAGARDISRELAKLAKSQGADYRDIMYMAGKAEAMFASQSEYANDEEKKRKAINGLMRTAVIQAKQYSIPVAEMAKELPKLAGIATMFEGDAGRQLVSLMGAAQLAEAGAAKNPAAAATYAARLATSLKSGTTVREARRIAGVEVFSSTEKNKLRDVRELIVDIISSTEKTRAVKMRGRGTVQMNQLEQLQAIFPNLRANLGLQKYVDIFTEAGGGTKGVEALNKELGRLAERASDTQIDEDYAVQIRSMESRTAKFNQQLERVVSVMVDDLIPVAEQLAPKILELVKGFGDLIGWMARNPGLTIGTAISASIARAGLESTLRAGIERMIMRVGAGGGTMGAGGAPTTGKGQPFLAGGALGIAGAALTITATAVTLNAVGRIAIDWGLSEMGKAKSEQVTSDVQREVVRQNIARLEREGKEVPKALLEKESSFQRELSQRVHEAELQKRMTGPAIGQIAQTAWQNPMALGAASVTAMMSPQKLMEKDLSAAAATLETVMGLGRGLLGLDEGAKTTREVWKGREDIARLDALKSELASLNAKLGGTLRTEVVNQPSAPPGVSAEGRASQ